MKDVRDELNAALRLIGALSVNGDAVDVVAGARAHIRAALGMLREDEAQEEAAGHGG